MNLNRLLYFVNGIFFILFMKAAFGNDIPVEKNSAFFTEYTLVNIIDISKKPFQPVSADMKNSISKVFGKITLTPTAVLNLPNSKGECENVTFYQMPFTGAGEDKVLFEIYTSALASQGITADPASMLAIYPKKNPSSCNIGFIWVNQEYLLIPNLHAMLLMIFKR